MISGLAEASTDVQARPPECHHCDEPDAKPSQSGMMFASAGSILEVLHMPVIDVDPAIPSIIPASVLLMSDDECLARLARAVKEHDASQLDEVARLIGRLAVPIE
jgi:hypothetical protein